MFPLFPSVNVPPSTDAFPLIVTLPVLFTTNTSDPFVCNLIKSPPAPVLFIHILFEDDVSI